MRDAHQDLAERGWTVVAVGQGTGGRSAAFRRDNDLPFVVLGDPERAGYAAFGLKRASALDLLRPSLLVAAGEAIFGGARQSRTEGEASQTPGTFIIDRAGIVRYAHPAAHAGDIPTAALLVLAVDSVVAG